jgi:hypothetical protein
MNTSGIMAISSFRRSFMLAKKLILNVLQLSLRLRVGTSARY